MATKKWRVVLNEKMNRNTLKKFCITAFNILLYGFAGIGVLFIGMFFAIKYHVTDVSGTVDVNDHAFARQNLHMNSVTHDEVLVKNGDNIETPEIIVDQIEKLAMKHDRKMTQLCKITELSISAPKNADKIFRAYQKGYNDAIVDKMIFACELRADEDLRERMRKCLDDRSQNYSFDQINANIARLQSDDIFSWMNDEEWQTIKEAVVKDRDVIEKAAHIAKIEPRLIVSNMIVEQVRLFHSQRGLYKKFFEPLKILGNATKISLGVMGIKEATAMQIENNLKDKTSPYYLGDDFENILDFTTHDSTSERYARLTNENDHYYSYLYGGLYLKQMIHQWQQAGYDIQYRPEIVGTLFNVGFPQSSPNPHPKVGGSSIAINDATYSFGSLAYEFYYSGELLEEFPFVE